MMLSTTFFLLLSSISFTIGIEHYITSSTSERCLIEPCLTLAQFANNTSEYLDSNTTLIFKPGNHTLNSQLTVSMVANFSIIPYSLSVTSDTNVVCGSFGRLDIYNVSIISILGINFIGCVSNRVISVRHLSVENSCFLGHENVSGRALQIIDTNGSIVDNLFAEMVNSTDPENVAVQLTRSNISIIKCVFKEIISTNGAIFCEQYSTVNILKSTFYISQSVNQQSELSVGILYLTGQCSVTVYDCLFHGNEGMYSYDYTVVAHNDSSLTVDSSEFRDIYNCGVISAVSTEMIFIYNSTFFNNWNYNISVCEQKLARMYQHIISLFIETKVFIGNCQFTANRGGVLGVTRSLITISKTQFVNNTNHYDGGALWASYSTVKIKRCQFKRNKAHQGGALQLADCNSTIENSVFMNNSAVGGGALDISVNYFYYIITTIISESNFSSNQVTFSGGAICYAESNCTPQSLLRVITFQGTVTLSNNQALRGGGALSLYGDDCNSQLNVLGRVIVANNTVSQESGGGIYLYRIVLTLQGNGTLELLHNNAGENGGGMLAELSTINTNLNYKINTSSVYFLGNHAVNGGGLYLCDSQVYVYTSTYNSTFHSSAVQFIRNSASHGGALYLGEEQNWYTIVLADQRGHCFLQIHPVSTHTEKLWTNFNRHYTNIFHFSQNHAKTSGSSVYKQIFGYCTMGHNRLLELTSLTRASDLKISDVGSLSIQVCFCDHGQLDCFYQKHFVKVIYGKEFTIEAAIADRGNHLVNGSINNQIGSGLIQENQKFQDTSCECTRLKFNVFSTERYQLLKLVPVVSPPYIVTNLSSQVITLEFPFCISCPIGFEKVVHKVTGCDCVCDPDLKSYIVNCDASTEVITKGQTTAWIGYVNSTNGTSGYLVYPYCPYRYCLPPDVLVDINLNIPDGADTQCTHNRSGILCGTCAQGLSLSLGSSKCISCPSNWKRLLVAIFFGQLMAGVLLAIVILSLNLTVAVGTLNGIIFYANIVAANTSTFFPSSSFLTVFIAWINLELGIHTCFFEGMDAYWKVWVELAFPTFMLLLIILIIITSERYVVVARLVGKKNPVATLDTLILLSYMKFLRIIIASYSFAILNYPDGSNRIVWLPDATIAYFSGKHTVLLIVATLILIVGIAYTALLFSWQWMLLHQRRKVFKWVRYQRLSLLIEPYHAPYNFKHRYWTGMLLLIRVVLYIISAMNVSGDPGVGLLATGVLVSGLIVFKALLKNDRGIYKKRPVEFLEIACYVNIVWFCLARYYTIESERGQFILSCISGSIVFALFVAVLAYHVVVEFIFKTKLIKKIQPLKERFNAGNNARDRLTVNLLSPDGNSQVDSPTHTEIHLSALINDSDETKCSETSEIDQESNVTAKPSKSIPR